MPSPRTVLITGANRGIGFQLLQQMLKLEQRPEIIFATYRSEDSSKELLEIAKRDKSVQPIKLDVKDHAAYSTAVQQVRSLVGSNGLNLLINNAGILASRNDLAATTADDYTTAYAVNAVAPVMLTRAFLPLLQAAAQSGHGDEFTWSRAAIVNVTSDLGSIKNAERPIVVPYRMSKAALNMFTKCLSCDLMSQKILVVAVHPGWVQTDMGGPEASLTKEKSVDSILNTLQGLGKASTGGFVSYDGSILPY